MDRSQSFVKDRNMSPENLPSKLLALAMKSGYQIVQTNGQRVYAPSNMRMLPIPPKGCELFVGKIPKCVYEDELVPLFEGFGEIYKFR